MRAITEEITEEITDERIILESPRSPRSRRTHRVQKRTGDHPMDIPRTRRRLLAGASDIPAATTSDRRTTISQPFGCALLEFAACHYGLFSHQYLGQLSVFFRP